MQRGLSAIAELLVVIAIAHGPEFRNKIKNSVSVSSLTDNEEYQYSRQP